jgi:hypothetical protein
LKPFNSVPFLLKGKDRYAASWNQEIEIDINLSSLIKSEITLLLELVDYDKTVPETEDKWYRIAWAFLNIPTDREQFNKVSGKEVGHSFLCN